MEHFWTNIGPLFGFGLLLDYVEATLGQLLGDFGTTFGPLWDHFWTAVVTLLDHFLLISAGFIGVRSDPGGRGEGFRGGLTGVKKNGKNKPQPKQSNKQNK